MIPWRSRQQFKYFFLVSTLLLIAGVAGLFFYANTPGSCSDGTQNNGELGVDCGGSCARPCPFQVSDVVSYWARAFPVREGVADAVALLSNPNFNAGARKLSYSFKLYDANNVLSGERAGTTFINPGEQFVIYESGIRVGSGAEAPQRAFFDFRAKDIPWETAVAAAESELLARDTRFEPAREGGAPKVVTTLVNRALVDADGIEVVALLYGAEENVIDASKTTVSSLAAGEAKTITLLLSPGFSGTPARIDIFPRRNMFD